MDVSFSLSPYDPIQGAPLALPDYGAAKRPFPTRRWRLVGVLFTVTIAVMVLVVARTYVVREFPGVVVLEKTLVDSPLAGRLARVMVAEGQRVRVGERLFEVESPELASRRQLLARSVADMELAAQTERAKVIELNKQSQEFLEQARSRLRRELTRVENLAREGVATRNDIIAVQTDLFQVELRLNEETRRQEIFQSDSSQSGYNAEILRLRKELNDTELAEQQLIPVSPIEGIVVGILAQEGSITQPGDPVVVVAKETEPAIDAYLTTELVGLVEAEKVFRVRLPDSVTEPAGFEGLRNVAARTPSVMAGRRFSEPVSLFARFRIAKGLPRQYWVEGLPVTVEVWPTSVVSSMEWGREQLRSIWGWCLNVFE